MCTYDDCSLVSDALHVDAYVVEGEGHAINHVIRVLVEVLQELLDIEVAALKQLPVVDVHDHGLEVLIFFLLQN